MINTSTTTLPRSLPAIFSLSIKTGALMSHVSTHPSLEERVSRLESPATHTY